MTETRTAEADTGFDAFAAGRWRVLMRAGWLLTGDWAAAEDLVQTTLTKVWRSWDSVRAADEPDAYVRRMLTNEFLGGRRRRMSGELAVAELPERAAGDGAADVDRRLALTAALDTLPPLQRATVVLRFFVDLSVEQTAQALGCSTGNVKSQTSRALAKLRSADHLAQLLEGTI